MDHFVPVLTVIVAWVLRCVLAIRAEVCCINCPCGRSFETGVLERTSAVLTQSTLLFLNARQIQPSRRQPGSVAVRLYTCVACHLRLSVLVPKWHTAAISQCGCASWYRVTRPPILTHANYQKKQQACRGERGSVTPGNSARGRCVCTVGLQTNREPPGRPKSHIPPSWPRPGNTDTN